MHRSATQTDRIRDEGHGASVSAILIVDCASARSGTPLEPLQRLEVGASRSEGRVEAENAQKVAPGFAALPHLRVCQSTVVQRPYVGRIESERFGELPTRLAVPPSLQQVVPVVVVRCGESLIQGERKFKLPRGGIVVLAFRQQDPEIVMDPSKKLRRSKVGHEDAILDTLSRYLEIADVVGIGDLRTSLEGLDVDAYGPVVVSEEDV